MTVKYWFTSDYHFCHTNIIKYSLRPFKTTKEMDEHIIKKHNQLVSKQDTVYFLGDYGIGKQANSYLQRLNGNFIFILGNHDYKNKLGTQIISATIESCGKQVFLVHDPKEADLSYSINIVGHVHNLWKFKKVKNSLLVNVGVDVWDFNPVQLKTILKMVNKGTFKVS